MAGIKEPEKQSHQYPRVSCIKAKMCCESIPEVAAMLVLALLCLCRNFSTKTERLLFPALLTPQIWHPATFFFYQSWSWHRKEEDLMTSLRFKKQTQATLAECKTQHLRKCFQHWRESWALVSSRKVTASKGQCGITG